MTGEICDLTYPYHPQTIHLHDAYVNVVIEYPENKLDEIGSWLDGIDVNRNAPDLWKLCKAQQTFMEGDLSIREYPEAEFVPTLVTCMIEF